MSRIPLTGEMAFPLKWPAGQPRYAKSRPRAQFKTTGGVALDHLSSELKLLGARYAAVSSNLPVRQDGWPYVSSAEPADPGVAVYFDYNGSSHCIACDKWDRVYANIRAIGKTVEALRGITRWGSSDMLNRAVNAFKALPATGADWRAVLGLEGFVTLDAVKKRYREMARDAHADHGGNDAEMYRLNSAMEHAERELKA